MSGCPHHLQARADVAQELMPNCEMAMLIGLENCCRIELADSADGPRIARVALDHDEAVPGAIASGKRQWRCQWRRRR